MLKRYLKIAFSGYSPERFLNMCKHKEMEIWGLEAKGNGYECYIRVRDFRKLKPLVKKAKIHIRILERHGLAFVLFRYRKRKLFLLGILLCFVLLYGMTFMIWNIEIQGNQRITSDVLYEYLAAQGIYHGMSVAQVDCEQICTLLRKDFTDIIWVSTSLEGTKLKIEVRENTDTMEMQEKQEGYYDIVADIEGTVTAIVTRKGVPQVEVGDAVQKGDVLVSGIIEVKNDAGEVIREENVNADADIYIKRTINFERSCPATHMVKEYYKTKKKMFEIRVFSYQVDLGIQKKEGNQEVKNVYWQCKLGDHFLLPIFVAEKTSREYEMIEVPYKEEEQKDILKEAYEVFRNELIGQEMEILSEELFFYNGVQEMKYSGNIEVIQQIVDLY